MAEPDSQRRGDDKLLTLSEVSKRTGISMPTLQRYKKLYQGRIPSVGAGRKQRYPQSALPVFEEIKVENIGRRGRPRKDAAAAPGRRGGRRAAAAGRRGGRGRAVAVAGARRRGRPPAAGGRGKLLTLTQISKDTGISYPTLVRYVRMHSNRLPHEGKGRARRFHPEAVDVFRQIRSESGRGGRKPGTGRGRGRGAGAGAGAGRGGDGLLGSRLRALERSQQALERRFQGFVKSLQKLIR
jgi:predicted DNA-binding transcriptional regulator AlpA